MPHFSGLGCLRLFAYLFVFAHPQTHTHTHIHGAVVVRYHDHGEPRGRIKETLTLIGKWSGLYQDYNGDEEAVYTSAHNSFQSHMQEAEDLRRYYIVCTHYRSSVSDAAFLKSEVLHGDPGLLTTLHMSAKDDLSCFVSFVDSQQASKLMNMFESGDLKCVFPVLNEMKLHDSVRKHLLNLSLAPESSYKAGEPLEPRLVVHTDANRNRAHDKYLHAAVDSAIQLASNSDILLKSFPSSAESSWNQLRLAIASHEEVCAFEDLERFTGLAYMHLWEVSKLHPTCMKRVALAVASMNDVLTVTLEFRPRTTNNYARGIVQTNVVGNSPYSDWGLNGLGQVVAVADDGLDDMSCFFIDDSYTQTPRSSVENPEVYSSRRKVIQYIAFADAGGEAGGHGTHVSGSVGGNCIDPTSSLSTYNGQGTENKIAFFDIGVTGQEYLDIPVDIYSDLLQVAYDTGARIQSDSWGSSQNFYASDAMGFDYFLHDNSDFTVFIAAGNDGQAGYSSVGSPATGKNVVSVGAGENDHNISTASTVQYGIHFNHTNVAYFSSVGPTFDQRFGVDIVAPGFYIYSVNGSQAAHETCSWIPMAGTSMATPTTAGTASLIRQYFENSTFWETQCSKYSSSCSAFTPSGVLVKAIVLHSGTGMLKFDQNASLGPIGYVDLDCPPDIYQGYGLLTLENVLPAAGVNDGMYLYVKDLDLTELGSFQYSKFSLDVVDSAIPLKITLVWYDPPNTVFSAKLLLHDLDLIVESPTGNTYVGNYFGISNAAVDEYNPNEQFYTAKPDVGTWTVYVVSKALTESKTQAYSLVITSSSPSVSEDALGIDWSGSTFGQYSYCGTMQTLSVGLFDYNGDGWDGVYDTAGYVQISDSSNSQTLTFSVVNDNPEAPQVYNVWSACVSDGDYSAILSLPYESSGTGNLAMAVDIPACNVFLNSRVIYAPLTISNGECNACASTDAKLTFVLDAGASGWTGWGTNFFTVFSNLGANDTMFASGTLEWAIDEMNKTVCLPDGEYVITLVLNEPSMEPSIFVPELGLRIASTSLYTSVVSGAVQEFITVEGGVASVSSADVPSCDEDDENENMAGVIAGWAIGMFFLGSFITAGIMYLVFIRQPRNAYQGVSLQGAPLIGNEF